MKLIFAQGNAETKYTNTRHNVGFFLVDDFVRTHSGIWTEKTKFDAFVAELTIDSEKVLCIKPTTYYNETGRSARALVDFYKLDTSFDVLALHDDLSLPFGTIRIRHKGSDAGNNGIKSLNVHLGQDYTRIRVGVWSELRDRINDVDFVLGKFNQSEQVRLNEISSAITDLLNMFVKGSLADHSTTLLLD